MSRIFITMGSAHSKAANVNPVDGIWCSDCGWAGRVEEDMTDSEESEEPLFEEFSEYVPKFCPNCGVKVQKMCCSIVTNFSTPFDFIDFG